MDAGILAEHRAQHQVRLGERIGAQHAVDVAGFEPGVADGAERRLRVQAHAARLRQLADLGVAGAGDVGVHRHGVPPWPLAARAGHAKAGGCLFRKRATAASWYSVWMASACACDSSSASVFWSRLKDRLRMFLDMPSASVEAPWKRAASASASSSSVPSVTTRKRMPSDKASSAPTSRAVKTSSL